MIKKHTWWAGVGLSLGILLGIMAYHHWKKNDPDTDVRHAKKGWMRLDSGCCPYIVRMQDSSEFEFESIRPIRIKHLDVPPIASTAARVRVEYLSAVMSPAPPPPPPPPPIGVGAMVVVPPGKYRLKLEYPGGGSAVREIMLSAD